MRTSFSRGSSYYLIHNEIFCKHYGKGRAKVVEKN
jgi:hypothetical protein